MVNIDFIGIPPKVEDIVPKYLSKMSATAILHSRPNSHPFPDRTLNLDEPVKIGRSVARARPSATNAIFDCKVLSRNHALLWYENGKFYLKDTKSSNGTFVNNYRLSKSSEESAPQEVCSGDIVQYGVDVMENSKKVTHGCIIATLKLYLPDGQEAKASLSTVVGAGMCNISSQEIYQLRTALQEAQHREQLIELKLASFRQIISSIQEAASQSWTAMIDEDRLLQRLETLEDQLSTYAKNCSEDATREEIRRILEEKSRYETSAKASLQRILQEKVDAVTKCIELERTLTLVKADLEYKKVADSAQEELQELLAKQISQTVELKKMSDNLKSEVSELKEKADSEKQEGERKLQDQASQERNLLVKIESLKADNDFTKEQLGAIKAKYENIKNGRIILGAQSSSDFKEFEFSEDEVKKTFQLFRSAVQALHERLWQAQEELHHTQSAITQLKNEAEAADKADVLSQTTKSQLQDELSEKKAKEEANSALIDHLQSQLAILEARLRDVSPDSPKIYEDIYEDNSLTLCKYKKNSKEEDNKDEKCSEKDEDEDSLSDSTLTLITSNDVVDKNSLNGTDKNRYNFDSESAIFAKEDIIKLQEILSVAEASRSSAKQELKRIRDEFGKAATASVTASHEAANLHHQLAASEAVLQEKTRYVSTLQEIGGQLESSVELIYSPLNALTHRIAFEKQETLNAKNESQDLKEKLKEAESLSKEGLEQMEVLRAKLRDFEEQFEAERGSQSESVDPTTQSSQSDVSPPSLVNAVPTPEQSTSLQAEKLEESDEIVPKLQNEIAKLKKAYDELKEIEVRLREQLELKASTVHTDLSDGETKSVAPSNDLDSVEQLKLELKNLLEERNRLQERLVSSDAEFHDLNLQNKMKIPTWLMLVLAIPIALGWQWLSNLF